MDTKPIHIFLGIAAIVVVAALSGAAAGVAVTQGQDDTVSGSSIEDRSVTGTDLAYGTVSGGAIAPASLNGSDIVDGSISREDLEPAGVMPSGMVIVVADSSTCPDGTDPAGKVATTSTSTSTTLRLCRVS